MPGTGTLQIRYAADERHLYALIDGSAAHRASFTVDRLVDDFLATQPSKPVVIIDLDSCGWVDSTFAGWLIKLRKRLAPMQGRIVVSRCPDSCRSSMETMGLTNLFHFHDLTPPPNLTPVKCPEAEMDAGTIEFIASAHEDLAEVDSQNQAVFGRIAEELRKELERRDGGR